MSVNCSKKPAWFSIQLRVRPAAVRNIIRENSLYLDPAAVEGRLRNRIGNITMKKQLLSAFAATLLLAGSAFAAEVTSTTTTTFTNEQGAMVREYSVTKHYNNVTDPALQAKIGVELPQTVTVYPLPETIKVQEPDRYSYVILNDRPVVIERKTRRIIHTW